MARRARPVERSDELARLRQRCPILLLDVEGVIVPFGAKPDDVAAGGRCVAPNDRVRSGMTAMSPNVWQRGTTLDVSSCDCSPPGSTTPTACWQTSSGSGS